MKKREWLRRCLGALAVAGISLGLGVCHADAQGIDIDKTNFPGDTFRKYIKEEIDRNEDGILSDREIQRTKSIQLIGEEEVALSSKKD